MQDGGENAVDRFEPYPPKAAREHIYGSDGEPISIAATIFPIFKAFGEDQLQAIGTGFFISHRGLFVTARHVAFAWIENDDTIQSTLFGAHFEPQKNNFVLRGIERMFVHQKADVAVGIMKQTEIDGQTTTYNYGLPVSFYWPRHSESVLSIAFPNTFVSTPVAKRHHPYFTPQSIHGGDHGPLILPSPLETRGNIAQLFKDGRDRRMLPGPCYQANMFAYAGASGGPVFGMNGAVIGVTNSGYDDLEVSYFTPISEIRDIELTGVQIPGVGPMTFDWLAENGYINLQADDDYHPLLKHGVIQPRKQDADS